MFDIFESTQAVARHRKGPSFWAHIMAHFPSQLCAVIWHAISEPKEVEHLCPFGDHILLTFLLSKLFTYIIYSIINIYFFIFLLFNVFDFLSNFDLVSPMGRGMATLLAHRAELFQHAVTCAEPALRALAAAGPQVLPTQRDEVDAVRKLSQTIFKKSPHSLDVMMW